MALETIPERWEQNWTAELEQEYENKYNAIPEDGSMFQAYDAVPEGGPMFHANEGPIQQPFVITEQPKVQELSRHVDAPGLT
jgi:hypothetical protein